MVMRVVRETIHRGTLSAAKHLDDIFQHDDRRPSPLHPFDNTQPEHGVIAIQADLAPGGRQIGARETGSDEFDTLR